MVGRRVADSMPQLRTTPLWRVVISEQAEVSVLCKGVWWAGGEVGERVQLLRLPNAPGAWSRWIRSLIMRSVSGVERNAHIRAEGYGLTDLHVDPAAGPRDDTVHSMHSVGSIGECVLLVGAHAGRTYVELICVLCAPRCAIVCRYCVDAVHRIGLQRPGVPGPCACQSICAATTGYIRQAQRWPGSCVSAPCSRELPFAVARVHNVTDAGTSTQTHPLIMVSSDLE